VDLLPLHSGKKCQFNHWFLSLFKEWPFNAAISFWDKYKMASQTIFVTQGTDFSSDLTLQNDDGTPVNIAYYVFTGAVRQNPFSNYPAANLNVTINDAVNGNSTISVNAAVTANMPYGSYIYNILAYTGSITIPILNGDFIVLPSATVAQPLPPNVVPLFLDDTFYALQGQNSFYLSYAPDDTANVVVIYNGVAENNSPAIYTITGNILVLANSANQGDVIQVMETANVSGDTVFPNPRVFAYFDA